MILAHLPSSVPTPVIVHQTVNVPPPSSLEAWVGLGGVVVGALIAGVLNLWVSWLSARRERRRSLDQAIGQLQASAHLLVITTNVARGLQGASGTQNVTVTSYQIIAPHIERVVAAAEMISRLSTDMPLIRAAEEWADAAVSYIDPRSNNMSQAQAQEWVTRARKAFQENARAKQGLLKGRQAGAEQSVESGVRRESDAG